MTQAIFSSLYEECDLVEKWVDVQFLFWEGGLRLHRLRARQESDTGRTSKQNTMRALWGKIEAVFALYHCQYEKRVEEVWRPLMTVNTSRASTIGRFDARLRKWSWFDGERWRNSNVARQVKKELGRSGLAQPVRWSKSRRGECVGYFHAYITGRLSVSAGWDKGALEPSSQKFSGHLAVRFLDLS